MRREINIENDWRYLPTWDDGFARAGFEPDGEWQAVCLPHTNKEIPLNGFDEKTFQFISAYTRLVDIPAPERAETDAAKQRFFLDFDGVMTACAIWVDGKPAGTHRGGFTPFSLEITDLVTPGRQARVTAQVDATERPDIPPFGGVVDYLCYGGIYREARLRVQSGDFLETVFARSECAAPTDRSRQRLTVEAKLNRASGHHKPLRLVARLSLAGRPVAQAIGEATTDHRATADFGELADVKLWGLDHPTLYDLTVTLEGAEGGARDPASAATGTPVSAAPHAGTTPHAGPAPADLDSQNLRIGFRTARFEPDGFYLNGERIKLRGLNRHQAWPYVGYAMPKRAQRRDAEILKRELGCNIVRTSHYPQSPHFLDACDELGLLVFTEIPGWQHIGDAAWQDQSCRDLEAMIVRDRNHPSVVLWGARINESGDNHAFYSRTNRLARELDPTRQTGGVRYLERSELLEDVYTRNDFTHAGEIGRGKTLATREKSTGLRRPVPYLVTEHNGHMYPTKRFDNEERLMEHALRHGRVLNAAYGDPDLAGAIGWCAFDYNTHKDFGSGDRVCYHGVSDLFREPKYAAAVYASQQDFSTRPVLEAATLFTKGERSGAHILPIQIWTNCDSVEIYNAGKRIGEYFPDREAFPNLPHPPIVVRDLIGDQLLEEGFSRRDADLLKRVAAVAFSEGESAIPLDDLIRGALFMLRKKMGVAQVRGLLSRYMFGWGRKDETFEIVGRVGGVEVLRRTAGGDGYAIGLEMRADDRVLDAGNPGDAWDVTRVVIRAVDQYGNLTPFTAAALQLAVKGPGELIGPSLLPLTGGLVACWVRTVGKRGTIRLTAESGRFPAITTEIVVK